MKLVSVIMPAYNCEKYISEAIESVINQTYQNWELIIVNDCSIDVTQSVITQYAQRDRRIRSLTNDVNKGVALTRLKGIENAKGEYIALLDSDDTWEPDKLKLQMDLVQKDKAIVLAYTGCYLIDEHSVQCGNIYHVPTKVSYSQLLYRNCITCSSVIVKKEVVEKAFRALPEIEDHLYHEDYVAWLMLLKEIGDAFGIDQALVSHRILKNSKSGNKLKSAKMQYKSLKIVGVNPINIIYYLGFYAINGIRKYRK